MKKDYSSPDLEIIELVLQRDVLSASDPEDPIATEVGGADPGDPFGGLP